MFVYGAGSAGGCVCVCVVLSDCTAKTVERTPKIIHKTGIPTQPHTHTRARAPPSVDTTLTGSFAVSWDSEKKRNEKSDENASSETDPKLITKTIEIIKLCQNYAEHGNEIKKNQLTKSN